MSTGRKIISLILHAFIAASTAFFVIRNLAGSGTRPADSVVSGFNGVENLVFYTVDSNILAGICAILAIIFIFFKKGRFPAWLHIVIMAAAVSVAVTFCTVVFVLAPGQAMVGRGYFSLFKNHNLYFHLINPLLAMICFIWFIPHRHFTIRQCLFGMIPTIIYTVFYTSAVVIFKMMPDIYNLTFGGHFELAPVSIIVMNGLSFGLAVLLTRLHNKAGRI